MVLRYRDCNTKDLWLYIYTYLLYLSLRLYSIDPYGRAIRECLTSGEDPYGRAIRDCLTTGGEDPYGRAIRDCLTSGEDPYGRAIRECLTTGGDPCKPKEIYRNVIEYTLY